MKHLWRPVVVAVVMVLAGAALAAGLGGCGSSKRAPVVMIGLDGADFDLLVPWMEQGELPNLKAFLDGAAVGELTTVFPILSPVCWTSAATGVNPGKHGIFDFQKPDPEGGEMLLEQANNRRATPVWMLLSDAGYRVGILNVPMTYPPDPVRGDMVSGFPFPSGDVNPCYPPELSEEMGEYPLDYLGLNLFEQTPEMLLEKFYAGQTARARVAEDWLASGDYDFLWLTFTCTDKIQHFFWRHMDPNHPLHHVANLEKHSDAILELWRKQDEILGRMLALIPENATVMMMSDHGFDAIYRQVNMANWISHTEVPQLMKTMAVPKLYITNGILHYELQGELPGGSDREAFLDRFIQICKDLKDPKTGVHPFEYIFRREDVFSGRMVEKAPDVVFFEAPKYYVTMGRPDSTDLPFVQDVWSTSFSANHRPEGIFAMRGPGVKPRTSGSMRDRLAAGGDFDHANIIDVAPTMLALMSQPIPDDMDGRFLKEGFTKDFLAAHPARIEEVPGFLLDRPEPSKLTDEERQQLKAIPYIQ